MALVIAAVRMGADPVSRLPEGAFHCWLDAKVCCPKCDATYNLVCDYGASVGRFFEEESRPLIMLLRKAVFLGHGNGHQVAHFETSGVGVRSFPEVEIKPEVKSKPKIEPRHEVQTWVH